MTSTNQITNNHCIIILGMHRSGTSALANYLCSLGFSLPSEPLQAHPQDNPEGYGESKEVVFLNHSILAQIGSNWKDVNPLPSDYLSSPLAASHREKIDALLESSFKRHSNIVLKDPRLCRLLPLWQPILQKYAKNLGIIHILRQPHSVYSSLRERIFSEDIKPGAITDKNHVMALWLRYNLEAEQHSKQQPKLKLSFERWITDPINESKRITNFLEETFPNLKLHVNKPELRAPRMNQPAPPPINDIDRTTTYTYHALLNNNSEQFLNELIHNFNISIPASNQAEIPSPPIELAAAAMLKHTCGMTPTPNLQSFLMDKTLQNFILYISDVPVNPCHIYRVKNAVDALNTNNIPAFWTTTSLIIQNLDLLHQAKLVIVHRSQWNDNISSIYTFCRHHSIPALSDIDDIIFDTSFIDRGFISFISKLGNEAIEQWKQKISAFRRTLLTADRCIASTADIQHHLNTIGKNTHHIPNGFSKENLQLSEYWAEAAFPEDGVYRLGYASGSPTHAADFSLIATPVLQFLEAHPDWVLCIIGDLDLSPYSELLPLNRVEVRPRVAHINLAYELSRLDINLIPLERNPFCDAKSPLKWYESALCGTPSIATNNPMYTNLFSKNNSGLLAETPEEWLEKLNELADSLQLRTNIANNAKKQALETLHPNITAKSICKLLPG